MRLSAWSLTLVAAFVAACVDLSKPSGALPVGGAGGPGPDGAAATGGSGGSRSTGSGGGGGGHTGGGGTAGGDLLAGGTGGSTIDDGGLDAPSGTGGIAATGGASGAGGTLATSGTTGTGGKADSGGTTGTGGRSDSGGVIGRGGATGSGGVTGTGGAIGTGGTIGTGGAKTPDAAPDLPPDASTLGNGLVAYYKCDETAGTTLSDSSGNANHGTVSGTYTFVKGKVGGALNLAKSGSGYASLPVKVFASLSDCTIATWVNVTTQQNWQRIFDTGINKNVQQAPSTGTQYMNLASRDESSNLRWAISVDGYTTEESLTAPFASTGVWKHVAVVLAGGVSTLYVDGAQAATDPTAIVPADLGAIDYAFLGRSQFGNDPYYDGMIDEFRVYNRALSAAEISALCTFAGP